jgi:hypothetical protein
MKRADKLHTLIHSMDKSEKRYFQLSSNISGNSENKKYLKIFSLLQSMKEYDEKKFIGLTKIKGISIKNLGSDKAYLYYQILKSLRKLNSGNKVRTEVREWLDISDVLFSKGLYDQSLSACNKAKKLAERYTIISLLPDVLLTERKIFFFVNKKVDNHDNQHAIKQSTDKIYSFAHSDYLYRQALSILQEVGRVRLEKEASSYDELLSDPLFSNDNLGIHAHIRRNQTLAIIHFSKGETQQEYERMKDNLDIMDTNPNFKNEHIYEYIIFFSHVLRLTKFVNYQNYEKLLADFFQLGEQLEPSKRKAKAQIYSLGYSTETVRLLEEGLYENGVLLIPGIQQLEKKYGHLIPTSVYMTFEYKFAYFHFGMGNLTQALKHINLVINNYTESDRKDVFRYAKVFSLIIHYELGNYSLISYNIRSLHSFLKKRELLYFSENATIQCLKKLPRAKSKQGARDILIHTKEQILSRLNKNERVRHFLEFFDVITWIDSKLENKTFMEVKQEKFSK